MRPFSESPVPRIIITPREARRNRDIQNGERRMARSLQSSGVSGYGSELLATNVNASDPAILTPRQLRRKIQFTQDALMRPAGKTTQLVHECQKDGGISITGHPINLDE